MGRIERTKLISALACALACGEASSAGDSETGDADDSTGTDTTGTSATDESESGEETETDDSGAKFDVMVDDLGGGEMECKVVDEMDGVAPCMQSAPADSFTPDVQWAWAGDGLYVQVMATPVVANLTDDNDDGEIDLCDTPDIVVSVYAGDDDLDAYLYALDGETGQVQFKSAEMVMSRAYPAVGDIDGDGVPEIVTAQNSNGLGRLVAFENDGSLAWHGDTDFLAVSSATALGDVDADGDVEIVHAGHVADDQGKKVWADEEFSLKFLNVLADLDDDDDLEIVLGNKAYHHDGTLYYDEPSVQIGLPQVADLDGDLLPEVLVVGAPGMWILEHDGSVKVSAAQQSLADTRPAAIHDMDGDEMPEIVVGAANTYSMFEADLTEVWTEPVVDASGYAGGTAFDFLGDGTAEAMYADETTLFVFDSLGMVLMTASRESWTQFEYPVVADVDNDGSAEIVVVSNAGYNNGDTAPVQVIRDMQDRWIPARRIWNQHTYHVTNVREDGTIPTIEPKHWLGLNTFRTQAQSENGSICDPEG